LWAEVFRVQDNEFGWERVSDDVVPINITCLEESSNRVFQITAYSRNAMKLFDARIIHPGTPLYQANECFVHWKDLLHNCEWGLNFTSPIDAKRFQDCCAPVSGASGGHRSYAKSASSTSLRHNSGSL
uniref:WH1 domain-containing protein n=1 Tax=Macrostomum lignano TaxID=282301 RepID=A0A1I8IQ26_9PLAT